MTAAWGESDGSPLLVRLELLARLWGLMVLRWELCWVGVGLQLWHCCWDQEGSGQASATFNLCITVNSGHAGLAEQRKKAGVLGKHGRLQNKEKSGRWTCIRGGKGTSHATEVKVHEAVWLHQLLRSCLWCVLIDSPVRALWGHPGSLCMLERSIPRMGVSCGHLNRE